jgi:hypothetical protein
MSQTSSVHQDVTSEAAGPESSAEPKAPPNTVPGPAVPAWSPYDVWRERVFAPKQNGYNGPRGNS